MAKQFKRDRKGKFTHTKVAERTDVDMGALIADLRAADNLSDEERTAELAFRVAEVQAEGKLGHMPDIDPDDIDSDNAVEIIQIALWPTLPDVYRFDELEWDEWCDMVEKHVDGL